MAVCAWKIDVFGCLRATSGDRVHTRFRTHKTGELLAYLASFSQRPHRREELIDLLWPEYELESGRNCLRIALNALRQQLEGGSSPTPNVILADRQSVQLNPQSVVIDKVEFESCLAKAQRAQNDEERSLLLKQAVSLYHADLLVDYHAGWIPSERQRLADANLLALRRLIKLLAKVRSLDEALHYAQRAVEADALREESHRVLMRIYFAMGTPGAAVRQFQELSRILEEQLGSSPSAAARSLMAQITEGRIDSTSAGGAAIATVAGSAPPAAPVLPSQPSPVVTPFTPGVIPAQRTRFFGREECVAKLLEMFDTPETRLITLTGLGGSGKTRLALAVAERLYDDFNGAVWFVPLAAVTAAERIPSAILQTMGIRVDGATPVMDQAAEALSERPSLLILDNFEQLSEDGGVVLQELLDRLPNLTCLVTSRHRLLVSGEYEYAVMPLATPQSPGTPERLQEFASVQLFVDRAQSARRDFELTPANSASVASLCHYLEGIPLAIELAAAYVQALTPAQIRARLSPRLSLLVNRQKDAPKRHASLRATLEWSYQLLPAEVQRFLGRLSVFRDGWTLEAADALCADGHALEYLLQLRERSLITVEEIGETTRYRMLETVREYASEQLTESERIAASRVHAEFYLTQAEIAEAELVGPDAPDWLAALERDHPNFREALAFTLSEPLPKSCAVRSELNSEGCNTGEDSSGAALRIAAALWRFWYLHGHYDEGSDWLQKALEREGGAPATCMKAWRGAGNLAYDCGKFDRAYTAYTKLLSLARQTGIISEEGAALGSLGNLALAQGDLEQARLMLEQSLALFRQCEHPRGMALVLANLALVTLDSGDPLGACALHKESLALFEQTHDTHNLALANNNLGHAALQAGDYSAAQEHLLKSFQLARTLGSPFLELYAAVNLASLLAHLQRWRQAALLCGMIDNLMQERRADLLPQAADYYQEERARIERAMGPDDFPQLWRQGHNMRIDQVEALLTGTHIIVLD